MSLPQIVVLLVTLERLAELVHGQRNARRLLAAGGTETGAGHYPLFVVLHGGWLIALFTLTPPSAVLNWWLMGLYLLLQAGRLWVLITLGPRWTTRIITLPDQPLITGGPYRFLRHPNYLIVAAEIAVLPLAFGAWDLALAFTLPNLALLARRIQIEERALKNLRA